MVRRRMQLLWILGMSIKKEEKMHIKQALGGFFIAIGIIVCVLPQIVCLITRPELTQMQMFLTFWKEMIVGCAIGAVGAFFYCKK